MDESLSPNEIASTGSPLPYAVDEISRIAIKSIEGYPDLREVNNRLKIGGPNTPRAAYNALRLAYVEYVKCGVYDPDKEGLFGDRDDIDPRILSNLLTNGRLHLGPKSMKLLKAAVDERLQEYQESGQSC